jgi:hypothetical protein
MPGGIKTRHEYDVNNLPDRINFHKAAKSLPLPGRTKDRLQIYLSTLNRTQLKELSKNLTEEMHDLLKKGGSVMRKSGIIIPNKSSMSEERREHIQKAIWAKAMLEFIELYATSLKAQDKL